MLHISNFVFLTNMSKINVLHILTSNASDSVQLDLEKQAHLLNDLFTPIVLIIQERKQNKIIESSVIEKDSIKYIKITYPIGKNIFSKTRTFLNSVTTGLSELIKLNIKIDLVHCHSAGKNLWISEKYFNHIPCILSENFSIFINGRFEEMNIWRQKRILKRINHCLVIYTENEELKEVLINLNISTPINIIEDSSNSLKDSILKEYNQFVINT